MAEEHIHVGTCTASGTMAEEHILQDCSMLDSKIRLKTAYRRHRAGQK